MYKSALKWRPRTFVRLCGGNSGLGCGLGNRPPRRSAKILLCQRVTPLCYGRVTSFWNGVKLALQQELCVASSDIGPFAAIGRSTAVFGQFRRSQCFAGGNSSNLGERVDFGNFRSEVGSRSPQPRVWLSQARRERLSPAGMRPYAPCPASLHHDPVRHSQPRVPRQHV